MARGVTNLCPGVTRICHTYAGCYSGSLFSHWFSRQEGDCGLCLKLHRTCMIPGSLESFLRLSGADVPFKLMTHLRSRRSELTAWATPGMRGQAGKKSSTVPKRKHESPCTNFVFPPLIDHQPPYVRSLMLRGRMVQRLISLSSLPLPSTIPAAVYASQPQGLKRLSDSSCSLGGCSPWEVH